eukprot:1794815-Rhodomonas_salina.4
MMRMRMMRMINDDDDDEDDEDDDDVMQWREICLRAIGLIVSECDRDDQLKLIGLILACSGQY